MHEELLQEVLRILEGGGEVCETRKGMAFGESGRRGSVLLGCSCISAKIYGWYGTMESFILVPD